MCLLCDAVTAASVLLPAISEEAAPAERASEELAQEAGSCFIAGTEVQMADGTAEPIEDIQVGDVVKSRDPATGKDVAEPVVKLFRHLAPQVVHVALNDGETFTCTPDHRFFVRGVGLEEAGDLVSGEQLVYDDQPTNDGIKLLPETQSATVTTVAWSVAATAAASMTPVYNFEVESTHTYFIGTEHDGVWVHNDCTQVAQALKDAGYPGDIFRLELDPTKVPPIIQWLGNGQKWQYHDVLYDPVGDTVRDPLSFGHSNPVPFETWAEKFPFWDFYKWGRAR